MKKIIFLVASFITINASAQKVSFANKTKVDASKISIRQKNGVAVQHISVANLKAGQNYLKLKSGKTLYIEVESGAIKTLTLAKSNKRLGGKLTISPQITNFQCDGLLCVCRGDIDCNDMFTTGVCGDAICSEDICICIRNDQI